MPELSRLLIKRWLNGRPAEIWISEIALVEKMIQQYKLNPLGTEHYPVMELCHYVGPLEGQVGHIPPRPKKIDIVDPRPYPGGLRIPHLHFKNDVYLLTEEQWREFSSTVLKDLRAKLGKTRTITFDQLVETNAAISGL